MYEVIIAGASFAGLAVANQLRGQRVLLIDRKPIGTGQTSACGTMLPVLQHWDLTKTVLQTHGSLVLHTEKRDIEFPSPYLWCTFDYAHLCETLLRRSGADFLQAVVRGVDGEQVETNRGAYRGRYVVDASGWRAVLASHVWTDHHEGRTAMNFGAEVIRPLRESESFDRTALHFWYDPAVLEEGVGWVFPRGSEASFGLGSYIGARPLKEPLTRFARRFDVEPIGLHGAHFPCALRFPTAGSIFVVGDAAGMCIALTGEGIRPALFFGEACGRIIRRVLEGELTLEAGLVEYQEFVAARRQFFDIFSAAQSLLTRLPPSWIDRVALFIRHDRVRPWVLDKYWGLTRRWDGNGNPPARRMSYEWPTEQGEYRL